MPSFKCKDTGMACPFETSAPTEAELMPKIAKHAEEVHGMKTIPPDFMEKVKKAADTDGPAYVHIFSVCPTGWRTAPEMGIEIGKLAVQTGVFPLYEVENGKYKLSMKVANRKPVQDYLKPQGRFRHLSEDDIKLIQERTDKEYEKLMKLVEESQG